MLSDRVLDLAVALGDLAQHKRGIAVCPNCLSRALARRLVQIAPLIEDNSEIDKRALDILTVASGIAVDDVVEGECPRRPF